MKFTLLALLPFLCVKCFPWEECNEDVQPVCSTVEVIIPEVADTYAYRDGDLLAFGLSNSSPVATGSVERIENGLEDRFACTEVDEFVLSVEQEEQFLHIRSFIIGDTLAYRHLISRTGVGVVLILMTAVDTSLAGDPQLAVAQPGQRIIPDTTLERGRYQDVLVTAFDGGEFLRTVYLTKNEGFVQFDYVNGLRVFAID